MEDLIPLPHHDDEAQKHLQRLRDLWPRLIENLAEVGAEVWRLRKVAPELLAAFQREHNVEDTIIEVFVSIGDGRVIPRLAMNNRPGFLAARRVRSQAVQRQLLESGVEVAMPGGDVIVVQLHDLTPAQTRQALTPDGPRSIAQQRIWLDKKKAAVKPALDRMPWSVRGEYLLVDRGPLGQLRIHRRDLLQILARMN